MAKDFQTLYEKARQEHCDLLNLPKEILERTASEDNEESRRKESRLYVILMSILPFVYGLMVISAAELWRQTLYLAQRLAGLDYRGMFQALPGSRFALLLICGALLIYFVVLPIQMRWGRRLLPKSFEAIDYTRPSYIVVQVIAVWVALGLAIAFLGGGSPPPHSWSALIIGDQWNLKLFFTIWMVPFLLILSAAPLLLVVLALVALISWRSTKSATSRANILRSLLEVLSSWDPAKASTGSMKFQHTVAQRLGRIAYKIRRLNFGLTPDGKDEEWAARQYALASDNLLVCGSWLYVPHAQSIEAVRSRIVVFCNAFVTGQLSDLPRSEISESDGLVSHHPKRAVIKTALFAGIVLVYCVAPFALFLSLQHRLAPFGIPTNLWLLLYSLWLATGVFAYLEHTSQNTGETFINLVKIILGK